MVIKNRFVPELSSPLLTRDEIAFGKAVHDYKTRLHRPNPSWREILDVTKGLCYRRVPGLGRFKAAVKEYQLATGRKFLAFSEVHHILLQLGAKPPAQS